VKKSKTAGSFLGIMKTKLFTNLREILPLFHRNKSAQLICQLRIGEVIIVRDDHTPCRDWRLAQIKELKTGKPGQQRYNCLIKILFHKPLITYIPYR